MLLASFISWWYDAGWRLNASKMKYRLGRTSEFFSLLLLLKTLFSPYRQISAGGVRGNLSVKWRAFVDRTVSRFVGFFVRMVILIIGIVCLLAIVLSNLLWLLVWPLLPLSPIVMVVFMSMGLTV